MTDRCVICREPATPTPVGFRLCLGCAEEYDAFRCRSCGEGCLALKSIPHAETCTPCGYRERMSTLTAADRETIGSLFKSGDRVGAIVAVQQAIGVGIPEAAWIAHQFED